MHFNGRRKRRASSRLRFGQPSASRQSTPLASQKRPSPLSQRRRLSVHNAAFSPLPRSQDGPPANTNRDALAAHHWRGQRVDEDEADESWDHVIMAVDSKERDKIGCAYYVAREQRLFCMEDATGNINDIVESLKLDIQPTLVLLSPRIESAADSYNPYCNAREGGAVDNEDDQRPTPWQIAYRPSPEFSYDGAQNKLVNLESLAAPGMEITFLVPGESSSHDEGLDPEDLGLTDRQGKFLQMSALLDMDNKVSIGCVGAVITNLQRRRASEYLQDDPDALQAYRIVDVEMFSLVGTMLINADTLISLQIMQPESHPNTLNQGPGASGSKQSLSIYGLFHHYARSPQGSVRLRQYFTRPSLNMDEINGRLDFVSVFVRPEILLTAQKLNKSMSRIKNMRNTMTMLHKGISAGNGRQKGFRSGVWASLLEFCYHTIDIADTLQEVVGGKNLPLCARATDAFETFHLQRIGKMIHDTVDMESSVDQRRTVINAGVDERLDEVKGVYDNMGQLLFLTANKIARTLPFEIAINVIYIPQLGFHIAIPIDEATRQPVYSGGKPSWDRMFTTQNTVYFKDARMHDMDERLGDLYGLICDREIEISHDLAQKVLEDEQLLTMVSDICGELDCLLALAHGAIQYKLTRPRLRVENIIDIKACRHLIQEVTVPSYVPNDAFLVGGSGNDSSSALSQQALIDPSSAFNNVRGPSVVLLTGPNYSGKSVYQKSIALAVYMAHIGSFVPAETAEIGITDKIFTRISTRESVSKAQSTFMIDVQQLALAVNQCTNRSLVIIDEFGKGTDSCDGAGLAAGAFKYFLGLGQDCPKVLGATHFHEIFQHALDPKDHPNLALKHMEVHVAHKRDRVRGAGDHDSDITYLCNLKDGRSSLSYGTQCARMNGIPDAIVERAKELAELSLKGEDLVAICAGISTAEEEDLEDAEAVARGFLEQEFEESENGKQTDDSREWRSLISSMLGETVSGT